MPRRSGQLSLAITVGLVLAVVLDTFIQIAWKMAVAGVAPSASLRSLAAAVLTNRWFYAAMLAFAAQLWNWLRVLARADLSFAQPFTALSYITVLALSHRLLDEPLTATRIGGVALILLGVYCVSRTPVRTAVGVAAPRSP